MASLPGSRGAFGGRSGRGGTAESAVVVEWDYGAKRGDGECWRGVGMQLSVSELDVYVCEALVPRTGTRAYSNQTLSYWAGGFVGTCIMLDPPTPVYESSWVPLNAELRLASIHDVCSSSLGLRSQHCLRTNGYAHTHTHGHVLSMYTRRGAKAGQRGHVYAYTRLSVDWNV